MLTCVRQKDSEALVPEATGHQVTVVGSHHVAGRLALDIGVHGVYNLATVHASGRHCKPKWAFH